jgi:TonB-dependent receptor
MIIKSRAGAKISVSIIALCVASAAQAQVQPPSDQPPSDSARAPQPDIVITGQRASQRRAIDQKRNAIGVVDVAAADEIGRLPDRNVSEVIEHLPGVGVTYDQGEGRYVAIRGVPSNLNNYTVDGVEIGNPDGGTRALPLDIVSGQLLNRVEISKVKTADMDGQGIGGNVNLVTQTAFDFRDVTTVQGSVKAGHQQFNGKIPIQGDASVATRFGSHNQFGVVLGASYSDRDFYSFGFYPDNWVPDDRFARGGFPQNIKYTRYSLDRQRIGFTGSLDWHPTDRQTFFVRGVYSKFIEDEIRPRYRLDFLTTPFIINADGLTGTTPGVATSDDGKTAGSGPERREDLRLDNKSKSLATAIVGGSTEFDSLRLDYEGAYSRNQTLDKFPLWQFRCNPGTVNWDFTNKIYEAAPEQECTAQQMQFRQFQDHRELDKERIWQAKVDATYELGQLGARSFLKFGLKYRTSDRDQDVNEALYSRGSSGNRFTMGDYGLGGPGVCTYPSSEDPDQCYLNSPTFNIPALQEFTDQNLGGDLMPLNEATTLSNNTLSDFDLSESVSAAYAMGNLSFGFVTVTPGLRYEHTRLRVSGFQLQDGETIVPVAQSNSYDDLLPSLIVKIAPTPQTIVRLAYSRSLGRPEYALLSPGGSINSDEETASFGNPDLKPYRSENLDASAEYYFAPGGLLSVGVFGKFIKNPIFTSTTVLTDATFNGITYPTLELSRPENADNGKIIGIEAQYQQQFTFLPGLLSGLGVQVTGTLTSSTLHLPDGRKSTFPNQSEFLYGGEIFYQKGRIEASIAYHNTGHALLAVGDPAYNDQYNDDLRRLDAKASYQLMENIKFFVEAQNLTDEPTRQYQAGIPNWTIQNERYGRTFYAGVSAKF